MAQDQGLLGHPAVDVARLSSFLLDTKYGVLRTLCSYSGRIDTDTVQGAREGGEAVLGSTCQARYSHTAYLLKSVTNNFSIIVP